MCKKGYCIRIYKVNDNFCECLAPFRRIRTFSCTLTQFSATECNMRHKRTKSYPQRQKQLDGRSISHSLLLNENAIALVKCKWILQGTNIHKIENSYFNPCPAEPGYTLPLQTV